MYFKYFIILMACYTVANGVPDRYERFKRQAQQSVKSVTKDEKNKPQPPMTTPTVSKSPNAEAKDKPKNKTEQIIEKLEKNGQNLTYVSSPAELADMVNEFANLFDDNEVPKLKFAPIQRSRFIVPDTENQGLAAAAQTTKKNKK